MRARTANLLRARQALSQLSYSPLLLNKGLSVNTLLLTRPFVGLSGVEPLTSRLSGVRSNHLSYRPFNKKRQERYLITGNHAILFTRRELLRKEVIQPHLPVRLPCYDFAPVTGLTFDRSFPDKSGLGHRLRVLPTSMA